MPIGNYEISVWDLSGKMMGWCGGYCGEGPGCTSIFLLKSHLRICFLVLCVVLKIDRINAFWCIGRFKWGQL